MTVDETILFYSKHGNRAWQRFINAVDAGADPDAEDGDGATQQFLYRLLCALGDEAAGNAGQ